ncbi:AP2/ERF family transcription factor [Staphylococcus borealis]|uniref:AP2 domain-containing protein n=1 Tax=Staphylococcus borealis TaxID=2742203 RepID=UPI002DB833E3|nr:AP2 domain-containing protein [Staphylococcus borealis]MEB7365409.1 AP2 domain-containing protein [Staphylococcus borealis]
MVKSLFLQDGEKIFVDDEDYERVNQHNWHKSFSGNHRMIMNNDSKHLPNFILEKSFQMIKNNDFTRKNLTTDGNGVRWQKARFNNSSKYKGVSWDKKSNKWYAKIRIGEKVKSLGRYIDEDKAAMAYNVAVNEYWDGHGYLNIIGEDNRTKVKNYKTYKNQLNKRTNKKNLRGIKKINDRHYVRINYFKNGYSLGSYENLNKARLVYNKCSLYLHGSDAILNDVTMTDELKKFISKWEIPDKIKVLKEGADDD